MQSISKMQGEEPSKQAVILEELENILHSRFFRNSERGKQFLTYVVRNALDGRLDVLKERIIGAELFGKPANYATGEDPVVRVQAGEVRRRLEQYYHVQSAETQVRIELTAGSYTPTFTWASPGVAPVPPSAVAASSTDSTVPRVSGINLFLPWAFGIVGFLSAILFGVNSYRPAFFYPRSDLDRFWGPAFMSPQRLLIGVPEPIVYLPGPELYDRYQATHPGEFRTAVQRLTEELPLKPDDKIEWRDLLPVKDLGVAMGDVYAAVQLTSFFDRLNRRSQVRIGRNYNFEDLRTSPSVLVGAYNNKWTMQLTSDLRYRFGDNPMDGRIQENLPNGHIWRTTVNERGQVVHDYGLVTRLLNSKTGQFTVTIAGIAADGTQASAEFVSNPEYFNEALRNAPRDWEERNMEIVVETTVTDSLASPPHVVAVYFW